MKELKGLDYNQLISKRQANTAAIETLTAGGMADSTKVFVEENTAIEAELAGRKGEMLIAALQPAVVATVQKELAGKEKDLDGKTVIAIEITKSEDGTLEIKLVNGVKKSKASGEGGVSGGNRGERKGATVVYADKDGVEHTVEGVSAAEVLKSLQAKNVLNPNEGAGDSAVRVLNKAVKNTLIKSFTQHELPSKEEKASTEETSNVDDAKEEVKAEGKSKK